MDVYPHNAVTLSRLGIVREYAQGFTGAARKRLLWTTRTRDAIPFIGEDSKIKIKLTLIQLVPQQVGCISLNQVEQLGRCRCRCRCRRRRRR